MLPSKTLLLAVVLIQRASHSLQWIPIVSPQLVQRYTTRQLQIMKPSLNYPSDRPDFSKPKTQTFYRASFLQSQSPVYEFRYKVHDPKEGNYQEKSETRVGDSVRGYYSVQEPNGYVRLVKYVSDGNGFRTQVSHHHHRSEDTHGGYSFTMTRHV